MAETKNEETQKPRLSGRGQQRRDERIDRQAAALRANLRRRKSQMRAREDVATGPEEVDTHDHRDETGKGTGQGIGQGTGQQS